MFLFLLFYENRFHHCKSGKNRSVPIYFQKVEANGNRNILSDEFQNIRILFETSLLNSNTEDPKRCDSADQVIELSTGQYTCTSSDVLTSMKRDFILGALNELHQNLQDMIKVQPYSGVIEKQPWEGEVDLPTCGDSEPGCNSISNYDLIITFATHAFADDIVTTSQIVTVKEDDHRPLHGYIIINPYYIETSDMDLDYRNVFIGIVMHEVVHILGFQKELFEFYHPPGSNDPYDQIICTMKRQNKEMRFFVTPHAHTFAVKHFGLETFEGDDGQSCPSGIELEDYDEDFNHPKERVYFTEQINYMLFTTTEKFARITDVTLALLLDTGNYQINYTYFQPILWLNGDSIDGKIHSEYALGNFKEFPEGYAWDFYSEFPQRGSFDYMYTGDAYSNTAINCSGSYEGQEITEIEFNRYCASESFYNPNNANQIGMYGSSDYTAVKIPDSACESGQAVLPGFSNCLFYSITKKDISFTSISDMQYPEGLTFVCSSSNEGQEFTYRSFTNENGNLLIQKHRFKCPNQERFRRSIQLYNSYFTADPFTGDGFSYSEKYIPEETVDPSGSASNPDPPEQRTPSPSFIPPTYYDPEIEEAIEREKDQNFLGMGISKNSFITIIILLVLFIILCIAIPIVVKYWIIPLIESSSGKEDGELSEASEVRQDDDYHKIQDNETQRSNDP